MHIDIDIIMCVSKVAVALEPVVLGHRVNHATNVTIKVSCATITIPVDWGFIQFRPVGDYPDDIARLWHSDLHF